MRVATESASSVMFVEETGFLTSNNNTDDGGNSHGASSSSHYDDTQVLLDTASVYGTVFLVVILVFSVARLVFPRAYNVRKWIEDETSSSASSSLSAQNASNSESEESSTDQSREEEDQRQPSANCLSWIGEVYNVTDDQILRKCGLDALCLIRITRMGYKLR